MFAEVVQNDRFSFEILDKKYIFRRREIMSDLKIVEQAPGNYYYHLSETGRSNEAALCGERNTMSTELPLGLWGRSGKLGERYCETCMDLASKRT